MSISRKLYDEHDTIIWRMDVVGEVGSYNQACNINAKYIYIYIIKLPKDGHKFE